MLNYFHRPKQLQNKNTHSNYFLSENHSKKQPPQAHEPLTVLHSYVRSLTFKCIHDQFFSVKTLQKFLLEQNFIMQNNIIREGIFPIIYCTWLIQWTSFRQLHFTIQSTLLAIAVNNTHPEPHSNRNNGRNKHARMSAVSLYNNIAVVFLG